MPALRWEEQSLNYESYRAYSGKLIVGHIVRRIDGSIVWNITAVHMKYVAKGYAEDAKSIEAAKRAFARSWHIWCKTAGLR